MCPDDSSPSEISPGESVDFDDARRNKVRVSQEYAQAFRTRSYTDMRSLLEGTRIDLPRAHLSDSLLEPRRDILADMAESLGLHPLLVEYFDATLNACDVYESLLQAVHRARADLHRVDVAISKLAEEGPGSDSDKMCGRLPGELLEYSLIENPLSVVSMDKFRDLHDGHTVLLHDLLLQLDRMNRGTKLSRVFKKISMCVHQGVKSNKIMCIPSHDSGRKNQDPPNARPPPPPSLLGEELDVAAKVLYVQINDMDTVSRLVARLQADESHGKSRAAMASVWMAGDLWEGIIKELSNHGRCFMERLDELEERICLCLLTLNKSRMSVVHEIMNNRN
ncbi:hypothetical protein MLD38_000806 [Melastoma candidum]|uniref:Uncharacterized protein n=1 Tax=Melastoma candidum TaxID=119954 RepID=A0ACB9SBC8_9MYRT|nr:hypothetical protein MLD38_000806 [Melastoma candidum]